jgi:hypothetical protein
MIGHRNKNFIRLGEGVLPAPVYGQCLKVLSNPIGVLAKGQGQYALAGPCQPFRVAKSLPPLALPHQFRQPPVAAINSAAEHCRRGRKFRRHPHPARVRLAQTYSREVLYETSIFEPLPHH